MLEQFTRCRGDLLGRPIGIGNRMIGFSDMPDVLRNHLVIIYMPRSYPGIAR